MSKVFIEEETLIGIGNAIREKNGTTDLIATTDMATAISNLPTGGSSSGSWKRVDISGSRSTYPGKATFDLSPYLNENNQDKFIFMFLLNGTNGSSSTTFYLTMFSKMFEAIDTEDEGGYFYNAGGARSGTSTGTTAPGDYNSFRNYPSLNSGAQTYTFENNIFTIENSSTSANHCCLPNATLLYWEEG